MKPIKHKAFFDGMMVHNASRIGNALYWFNEQGKQCFDLFAFKQQDPAVLLDYIGFEDANHNEIYECDILEDDWNRRAIGRMAQRRIQVQGDYRNELRVCPGRSVV